MIVCRQRVSGCAVARNTGDDYEQSLSSTKKRAESMSSSNEALLIKAAARWKIPRDLAEKVIARDTRCVYCGQEFQFFMGKRRNVPSWEHIEDDMTVITLSNISLRCVGCNASKGLRSLAAWLESPYCKTWNVADRMSCVARDASASSNWRRQPQPKFIVNVSAM